MASIAVGAGYEGSVYLSVGNNIKYTQTLL